MLRLTAGRISSFARNATIPRATVAGIQSTRASHGQKMSDEEFDKQVVAYFNRTNIDSWEIRKMMNDLAGMDMVPEPEVICAGLRACRRLNDFALAIRFLESVKEKCANRVNEIYPYILQEIRPTLDELGINTPEELGYDKPELALQSVYHMH